MAAHVETGIMLAPSNYQSQVIKHLGLVAGMVDELGLVERIDQLLPKDEERRTLSHGQVVKAMIINGLGFNQRALYLSSRFFQDKPVARLIGEGIEADHINDDVQGRTLDTIYGYGLERFYAQLSVQAAVRLGLTCRTGHLDSTSFHVDGEYNSQLPADETGGLITITKGYSRDHRPDLNQVVLQLICEHQAGIPLLMKPLSGNSADKTGFRETIKTHIGQLQQDVGLRYLVADSALYCHESLQEMRDILWISRVPETLSLAEDMIQQAAPMLMVNPDEQTMMSLCTHYGEIRQRWLIVYSPEAYQRSRQTLNKQFRQQSQTELKAFESLCKQAFACETDARHALDKLQKKLKITELLDMTLVEEFRHSKPGRPGKEVQPDRHIIRITGTLATRLLPYQQKLARKSCFIVATNQLDQDELSDAELLQTYQDQQKVERGFRFLKDPQFMASTLFLKSVKRVMALTVIMTLCLLVYAALEYRIRKALREAKETFPNQLGQPVTKPTARWVFQFFAGIHILTVDQMQVLVLNMNDLQWKLLRLLGKPYEQLYS
jgi:transposase